MIRVRLLVCFVLVALLPVIGVGIGTFMVSYHNGRLQSIDRLESVAARKELAIQEWIRLLQQELQIASKADISPKLVNNALRLSNEGIAYAWYNNLVRIRLRSFINQSSQLEELFLIDLQGDVVVSTDPGREGIIYQDKQIFQQGMRNPATQLPFYPLAQDADDNQTLQQDQKMVIVLVPVTGDKGELLGVIGGRASVATLHTILNERTGMGNTGKAYLVDVNHALLMGTQITGQTDDTSEETRYYVRTQGVEDALQRRANGSGVYSGPLGASVIGVYRYIPDYQVVLAVEQDLSEAFRAISTTMTINLIIALGAVVIAVVASLLVTRSIANPIVELAETATQIASGDLQREATVLRDDEVGALGQAFNSMTAQLRDLINSLEQRVAERTQDLQNANLALNQRAIQLETSAQLGREITSILDLDVLLNRVVELIQAAFGYYHVQIFLLDREANQLVLQASSGNNGKPNKWLDPEKTSINSKAVKTSKAVLVNDVSQCEDFMYDDQLPATRSELVIPLRLGEQIIGTLDVQHDRINTFSEEDVLIIQSLGDQIVVAIENAHLYDQSRELAVLEERTRLARELHDSVTQSLYSLVLLTEGWRRMLNSNGDGQVDDYLSRIGEIAQQALKEMRLLIHELKPPSLEQEGLVDALRKRLDAVEKRVGIEARVLMDDLIELPAYIEEGLYRIAQEALNNALKHAAASKETVHMCVEDNQFVLEISDNGSGFDPQSVQHTGGMGLVSMQERAKQMDGILVIVSHPGKGTTVRISVPIPLESQPSGI
jgi:signal transduction histidine kinase